jgi:hypothetical protein
MANVFGKRFASLFHESKKHGSCSWIYFVWHKNQGSNQVRFPSMMFYKPESFTFSFIYYELNINKSKMSLRSIYWKGQ